VEPQNQAEIVEMANVIGKWTSVTAYPFNAAGCHPHCKGGAQTGGEEEGDDVNLQEQIPTSKSITMFRP
jgi:hypothetical protein